MSQLRVPPINLSKHFGLIAEFKAFIVKGNAIDLAVGIIIGAAFGGVVTSLVNDVVMPPIGLLLGGVDFSNLAIKLANAVPPDGKTITGLTNNTGKEIPEVLLRYGKFINALIALTIQGFCVFLIVKAINRLQRKEAAKPSAPPAPTPQEKLLMEIRDLLAAGAATAPPASLPPKAGRDVSASV